MDLRNRGKIIQASQALDLSLDSEIFATAKKRLEDPTIDLYYKQNVIDHKRKYRGRCLILNYMENHDHLGQRLRSTFSRLNYQCEIPEPVNASKTRELLRDESKSFKDHDSFILCILCKQPPSNVDFTDSLVCAQNTCLPLDTVIQIFRGDKCPALANKPKIIFFQTFPTTGLVSDGDRLSSYFQKKTLVPVYGNFLIYKYFGSSPIFINTLCDVLQSSPHTDRTPASNLIAKLTVVSEIVQHQTGQMAQTFSTLIKLFEI